VRIPPHITPKQVRAYLPALLHRDPDSMRGVAAFAKEAWDALVPPRPKS
jgi:hypothetical protein